MDLQPYPSMTPCQLDISCNPFSKRSMLIALLQSLLFLPTGRPLFRHLTLSPMALPTPSTISTVSPNLCTRSSTPPRELQDWQIGLIKELLISSGFKRVDQDKKRGLDHGAWVPLMLMYPEADIPVCQLSVQTDQDAEYHYNMGKVLTPLKEEGVLIVGSGSATHNLKVRPAASVEPWAKEFDMWLKQALIEGRYEDVNKYNEKAPHATLAHPTPEHFYPLNVAMGASGGDSKAELIHHSWDSRSLSYASYGFTTPT